jgi:gliding motility-associated-like protein
LILTGNKYYAVIVMLLLLVTANRARASHIYGGDLLYTHVAGDQYKISLTIYGDCSGPTSARLPVSSPTIFIYQGTNLVQTLKCLENISLRENVSPVCAALKEKTVCDDRSSTLPGAKRFVYTALVTLPPAADWKIIFEGTLDDSNPQSIHQAGRSDNITNINAVGGQIIYFEALLNNNNGHNSSPQYTSLPTPYYCINIPQQYNLGAVDNDKDSMAFTLIPALLPNGATVQYLTPYSATTPLASVPGSFSYNNTSGQLNFTPNITQRSLVVIRVDEYRNGMLVGSSMREMTFVVLPDCINKPPGGIVDSANIIGGGVFNSEINVCRYEPLLKLEILVNDPDGDNVTAVINNLPAGAVAKVDNNSTARPVIDVTWDTKDIPEGAYNMYVTYTDDACPLANSQTVAYTIRIIRPTEITHEIIKPTGCVYMQHLRAVFTKGLMPRNITISNRNTGQVLKQFVDSTGEYTDSFKKGNYRITAESIHLKCKTSYDFDVIDYGTYPIPVVFDDLNLCLNDPIQPIDVHPTQKATLYWYNLDGSRLDDPPVYNTDSVKDHHWLVTQKFDTCETIPDTFTVAVHDLPVVRVLNTNERLCTGDTVAMKATGAVTYNWQPEKWIFKKDTAAYAWVRQPTNYIVTGYSEYNCQGQDSIYMDNLDQCCQFFYPDAFSPNGDGLNDKWHPITKANTDFYNLAIYNRWGQRVFVTTSESEKWDGTYNGRPCEIGTYNFYMRSKCVMGRQESSQGTIILVR